MAVIVLMLGIAQGRAVTPFNDQFLQIVAHGSTYELEIAHLAQRRAIRPEVRVYAGGLVNDQEAYNAALRDLARSKGVALSWGMSAFHRRQVEWLTTRRDAAFDEAFIDQARRINAETARQLHREASITRDPDIRRFIQRFLKIEERHESDARALSGHAVASRMPVLPPPPMGGGMPILRPPGAAAMPVIPPPGQSQGPRVP